MARRILALAAVAVATVIAKALLYTARVAGDPTSPGTVRLVGLEIVLDLAVLALMATVAFTTFASTRKQDQLVQGKG